MEKILLAINATQINVNAIDFACYIANLTHSRLTGVFLEQRPAPAAMTQRSQTGVLAGANNVDDIPVYTPKQTLYDDNINLFKQACQNRGVNCYVHFDKGVPIQELIAETRFADILIVDPELSFGEKRDSIPTDFIKQVLSKSECPVVIAPYSFDGIDEILFTYDGSASAVFAMRQFTYLFPQLADKKVVVLEVIEKDKIMITQKEKVRELLQAHYSSIGFNLLKGNPGEELFDYLVDKKNVFVVMGAFGRHMLSDFWRKSTANLLMQVVDLPVFVAHH